MSEPPISSVPEWTSPRPFVGREDVLHELLGEVDRVVAGSGRALFLLGPAGIGKTALLGHFQELAYRRHRQLQAEFVNCAESGAETWMQLAMLFTRGHRLRRSAGRVALHWLEAAPLVGDLIVAIVKTTQAVRTGRVEEAKSVLRKPEESAVQAVRNLLEFGPTEPRLVIMDSLDRGDDEDLAGSAAFLRRLKGTRTLFVAAVRTARGRPPEAAGGLILEGERIGVARRVELAGLELDELRDAVSSATRGDVPDEWVNWLAVRSGGNPAEVWALLAGLKDGRQLRKKGRSWKWEGSPELAGEIAAQVNIDEFSLSDEDVRLLALAGVEGPVFHSAVLAALAGIDELELEDRLSRLSRDGVIEFRQIRDFADDVTSQYAFRDPKEADVFVAQLPDGERAEAERLGERARKQLGL